MLGEHTGQSSAAAEPEPEPEPEPDAAAAEPEAEPEPEPAAAEPEPEPEPEPEAADTCPGMFVGSKIMDDESSPSARPFRSMPTVDTTPEKSPGLMGAG